MSEPMSGDSEPGVVVLTERRGPFDALMALLTLACVAAAIRGASGAPVLAAIAGGIALILVVVWVQRRRRPPAQLHIGPRMVSLRRGATVEAEGHHDAGSWLRLTRNRSGTYLSVQGPRPAVFNLLGFDVREVVGACRSAGWVMDGDHDGASQGGAQ